MAQLQDDGFHEIQLNGKQLVFLFMAATVVSVVIFLLGVLVGRGVRAERAVVAEAAASNPLTEATPQPPPTPPPATPPGSDPTAAPAPAPASEELTYFDRLEKGNAAGKGKSAADTRAAERQTAEKEAAQKAAAQRALAEKEKTAAAKAPTPPPPPAAERPAPAAAPAPTATTHEVRGEPAGQGFAVQIAAVNVRSDADAIAKRLTSKGYAAYVVAPPSGSPSIFRVRVGKFGTRREAESVAAKLQKEEQFKPWVTR